MSDRPNDEWPANCCSPLENSIFRYVHAASSPVANRPHGPNETGVDPANSFYRSVAFVTVSLAGLI